MAPAPNESLPDAPSKIDQRSLADENTGAADTTPHEQRRASNIRDHHKSQIAELKKTIAAHEKIVEEQNVILGEVEEETDEDVMRDSSTSPLDPGTDVAERFRNAFDSIYTVEELQEELREAELPVSGNKAELIERLVAYHNGEFNEDEDEDEGDDAGNESTDDDPDNNQE